MKVMKESKDKEVRKAKDIYIERETKMIAEEEEILYIGHNKQVCEFTVGTTNGFYSFSKINLNPVPVYKRCIQILFSY